MMTNIKLNDFENIADYFYTNEILSFLDKDENIVGYFIPKCLEKDIEEFIKVIESDKRRELLKRVVKAQKNDLIED